MNLHTPYTKTASIKKWRPRKRSAIIKIIMVKPQIAQIQNMNSGNASSSTSTIVFSTVGQGGGGQENTKGPEEEAVPQAENNYKHENVFFSRVSLISSDIDDSNKKYLEDARALPLLVSELSNQPLPNARNIFFSNVSLIGREVAEPKNEASIGRRIKEQGLDSTSRENTKRKELRSSSSSQATKSKIASNISRDPRKLLQDKSIIVESSSEQNREIKNNNASKKQCSTSFTRTSSTRIRKQPARYCS